MPDITGNSKPINYSQEDATNKRLWRTQIGKANPWDHRTGPEGEEDQDPDDEGDQRRKRRRPEPPSTLIGQEDELKLDIHDSERVPNPFASLLAANNLYAESDDPPRI